LAEAPSNQTESDNESIVLVEVGKIDSLREAYPNYYSHYGVAIPGVDGLLERVLDEPDFGKRMTLCREVERQVLRDLPLLGLLMLSYISARNLPIDLGCTVRSGYAYWPLRTARIGT
jgi:peptide/nickel transport system substrate-binding protein